MRTLELVEILIAADTGGIFNDETRLNSQLGINILDSGRSFVLAERHAKVGRVHPNYIQAYYPEYDADLQIDDCFTLFKIPRIVAINLVEDGLQYVGSITGDDNFHRVLSRAQLSSKKKHRMHRLYMDKNISYLYDPAFGHLEVYRKGQRHIRVDGIFESPTSVYGFNLDHDDYPIPVSDFKRVEELVRNGTIASIIRVPANNVSNSQDDKQVRSEVKP
jgi:hypothetical protein